ncbi:hypothetical protein B932_3696 (plasmid) [Gluconobacter oxydans H24]|nr:hypothetical protein B932_3696 [Gluconobacter oxydans H24]
MSGWAGYMLGQMSADSARRRREVVDNLLRRPSESWQDRYAVLVAKAQEFLDHIRWQEDILQERKDRISALEGELAQAQADLNQQISLTKQWREFGDKSEANYDALKAWADRAEASLARYRALHGPLPPTEKTGS